jgi:integration host factor subunit beta
MIKFELVDRLYALFPKLKKNEALAIVNLIVEKMADSLVEGERIDIRGFGTFSLKRHPPRLAHNPKTKQKLMTQEKYSVHFRPSKYITEAINSAHRVNQD